MQQEAKIDFIVTTVAPWFLQFYISWYKAAQEKKIELVWVGYESFVKDNISSINNIEALLHIPVTKQMKHVPAATSNEVQRINKAVAGRGVELIADLQKMKIRQMMAFYPEVDFSLIS